MQSEDNQEAPDYIGPAGPVVIPLRPVSGNGTDTADEMAAEKASAATVLPVVAQFSPEPDECLISSMVDHPASGVVEGTNDEADEDLEAIVSEEDEPEPSVVETDGSYVAVSGDAAEPANQAVEQAYAILGQSSFHEVRALEATAIAAQAETDPALLRRRALDTLIRSEEEAHDIIESAQRDASSRTTRAELKAKLTLDQARERADLLIASAQARSELLIEEACKSAVFDIEDETRQQCEAVLDEAKSDARARVHLAADEGREIIDRARRQSAEIVASAELDADERRTAASEMFAAIESLEQKVEQDAVAMAEASAQAAADTLKQAEQDAAAIREAAAALHAEARAQTEVTVRNAHLRSEQIIAGADETASWFSERVQAREVIAREATEAHANDLLERTEAASLELMLNARERCNEMIAEAQLTVDRMLVEGRRVAQDLVGTARSEAATEGVVDKAPQFDIEIPQAEIAADSAEASFAGMWNESVDDQALDSFFDGIAERSAEDVFSQ